MSQCKRHTQVQQHHGMMRAEFAETQRFVGAHLIVINCIFLIIESNL